MISSCCYFDLYVIGFYCHLGILSPVCLAIESGTMIAPVFECLCLENKRKKIMISCISVCLRHANLKSNSQFYCFALNLNDKYGTKVSDM